ncbi:MAG: hypothetical protein P1P90_03955 [Patescibacteria group bacterium]|nr:hypothetical protein [Patescibacteria group bacterium]
MHELDEIRKVLFAIPPVRSLYFGDVRESESGEHFFKEAFKDPSLPSISVQDESLVTQRTLAAGLYPIMLVRYDITFPKSLTGEECMEILANLDTPVAYEYWIAYTTMDLVKRIVLAQTPTKNNRGGLSRTNKLTRDTDYFFDVEQGETLYEIGFTLNPLPGSVASC